MKWKHIQIYKVVVGARRVDDGAGDDSKRVFDSTMWQFEWWNWNNTMRQSCCCLWARFLPKMGNFAFSPEKIFKCLTSCGDIGGDERCDAWRCQERSFLSSFPWMCSFYWKLRIYSLYAVDNRKKQALAFAHHANHFFHILIVNFFCQNDCFAVIFSYGFEDSVQRDGFRWRLCLWHQNNAPQWLMFVFMWLCHVHQRDITTSFIEINVSMQSCRDWLKPSLDESFIADLISISFKIRKYKRACWTKIVVGVYFSA